MNILYLGARVTGHDLMLYLVRAFLTANFTGEERHPRRLAKIAVLERRFSGEAAKPSSTTERAIFIQLALFR